MSNTLFTSIPPPHRTISSTPIPPSSALRYLETYLSRSSQTENPHLHPDCRFNERGPTLEGRPPGGGLILHQLGRIAKGLKGIRLIPQEEGEAFQDGQAEIITQEGLDAAQAGEWDNPVVLGDEELVPDSFEDAPKRNRKGANPEKGLDEQMRDQGERGNVEGEIGQRNNIVADGGDVEVPKIKRTDDTAKKLRKEKKRKREAEKQAEREDEDVRIQAKRARREAKKERVEEQQRQQNEAETADALTVEADEKPNGQHSEINGVSSRAFEITGDVHPGEELERKARKDEKRAKKEAKKRAKESQINGARKSSGSLPYDTPLLDGNDVSPSPAKARHRANEKKKRRRREDSVEV